jgi:5-methylcytosine-specific restriction enzyme A
MPKRVPTCKPPGGMTNSERHRLYDRTQRDQEMKAFYHSKAWLDFRRWVLSVRPICEECIQADRLTPASHVHHIKPARDHPELRFTASNVQALCHACHSRIEAQHKGQQTSASTQSRKEHDITHDHSGYYC